MDARQKAIVEALTRAAQLVHDASFGSSPATEYEMKAEAKLLRALAASIKGGQEALFNEERWRYNECALTVPGPTSVEHWDEWKRAGWRRVWMIELPEEK